MFQGKGKYGGRGNGHGHGHSRPGAAAAAAAAPVAPRPRSAILPAPRNATATTTTTLSKPTPSEENFRLQPKSPLPFAMIIKLIPGLVEAVNRAEADGKTVQIKFGALPNNSSGNIIDVGGKEFRFTWAPEPGELCDIYEQKGGEKGNGVLVESGASWRKLGVQRILNESARDRVKMSSAEAERQQKSRKAIILDHASPAVKNQTKPLAITSNDSANTRKLLVKTKKEPPPKKRKIEESAAAPTSDTVAKPVVSQPNAYSTASTKYATSPVATESENPTPLPQPTSVQGTSGTHSSKRHGKTDEPVNCQHSNKSDVGKQKDKASTLSSVSVSEGGHQKSGACSTATDLRNLLITTLTENPKGMTIKAIEKAIRVSGKIFEPIIKTIATFQAPGKYILKTGMEKESSVKLSPGIGSSRECQPTESPFVESSPVSEKAEPTDEQQMHSTPTQDSDLNIVDEIDERLQESPNADTSQKNTINSDGSGSSSSSDSGSESDSDSDSGSSDSGSESGTSSDSESEASSSSSEESDVHVDIMSDDDKPEKEEETEHKLKDSKASPSHVDKDGSGERPEQKGMVEEKNAGRVPTSPGNSEDVDIGDDAGEVEAIFAKHNVEKIACDGEDETDMAVGVDVISCEGEAKIPEETITALPSCRKQGDSYSPFGGSVWEPEDNRSEGKENPIEEALRKSEGKPKNISRNGKDRSQTQTGYDKNMPKQENRSWTEKKEGVRADTRRKRDVSSSQSCYESPTRRELSPNRKDFETRKFLKEINKPRSKDTTTETAIDHGNPLGRSSGQSIVETQIDNRKDLDHERFDQLNDGHQSYSRSSLADSRPETTDTVFIEKFSHSSKNLKEIENAERQSRTTESMCRNAVDQNAWQSGEAGLSGRLFIRNTAKDNTSYDVDMDQLPSGKESVLTREYSELELGEFREPVYEEEEPQEFKVRSDKSQYNRDVTETKVRNGSRRESASPDVSKGLVIGRVVSEFKKLSPSVPNDDLSKHDGRIGKRMLEDGGPDLRKFSKKYRQSPPSDHVDLDPMIKPEKMLDMPVRDTTEMAKTSPHHKIELQRGARYRKTSNNLHKSEHRGRVQEATASENKDSSQRIRRNINSDQKHKENTRMEDIVIPKKRKHGSSNEDQSFYAKYEKNKPDLRGPIRNIAQYREYVAEYNDKYSIYMKLHTALESDKIDFEKLGMELQSAEERGDTKSYASVSEKVKETFGCCGPRHKRMKKVFVVLHEELQILKQRASDFAGRYFQQK